MKSLFFLLLFLLGISAIAKGSESFNANSGFPSVDSAKSSSRQLEASNVDTNLEDTNN